MLSDEEKKEYEELKSLLYTGTISQYGKRKLIDIIEKQSKEIEELKEKNKEVTNLYCDVVRLLEGDLYEDYKYYKKLASAYQGNSVSKDKIKVKIEELEKQDRESRMSHNYLVIPVLQSLLEKE